MKTNNPETTLFYFSSTGNSLTAARKIAEQLGNSKIVNIPGVMDAEIDFTADRIIVVFPIYMWGLPNIISRFFDKIRLSGGTELYAVATNAGLSGDPFKKAEKILKKNRQKLTSGYLVWMPENFTARYPVWPSWMQNLALRSSDKKIERISKNILNRQEGIREKSFWGINWFLTIQHNILMHKLFIEKALKASDYFWSTDNCNGCGICAKICPVENITMIAGKPEWGDHCEVCVACLQWCPQRAVQFRKATLKRGRYHHPDVVLKDFILR